MKTVSIVIPTCGHYELTHQLLLDILHHNSGADEILVFNDGFDDPKFEDSVRWWKENFLSQIVIQNFPENRGFLLSCNDAIQQASGDIIVLVSNDVRMQDDVVNLVRNLYVGNPKLLVGGIKYDGSTGWNEFKIGLKPKIFPYLEGWLLIFSKESWNELGGFDERYAPSDFEDVDLCTKAIECGYVLTPLNNPKIRHLGGQTIGYGEERQKITQLNREKFAQKWGVQVP